MPPPKYTIEITALDPAAASEAVITALKQESDMADEVSKTGVYIDSKTGKVVTSPPEEGVQLVPPGGTIDPAAEAQIEAAKTAAAGRPSEPKTVATSTAKPKG